MTTDTNDQTLADAGTAIDADAETGTRTRVAPPTDHDVATPVHGPAPATPEGAAPDGHAPARGTMRVIALDRLVASPDNVRTLRPGKDPADRQLVESIRAHGLLENLVVVACDVAGDGVQDGQDGATDESSRFEVVAGERRRLALCAIVEDDPEVPASTPVPCLVVSRAEAVATSLAENEVRRAMRPADRHAAFRRLVESGATEADVARQYGIPKAEVRRLLRLGALHPTLLEHFRADRLTLDAALAYAGTADTELQLAVFDSFGGRPEVQPWSVRNAISHARVPANGAAAKFVGTAYRKAGGAREADLFEGGTWLTDVALLQRLVDERLAAEAAAIEGWAWVETARPEDANPWRFERVAPSIVEVPEAVAGTLATLRERLTALEVIEYADLSDEDRAELGRTADEIEALEHAVETEHSRWSDEDRRFAGCLVTFDRRDGSLVVHEGLRGEDDARRVAAERGDGTDDDGVSGEGTVADDEPPRSTAFTRDLGLARRQAIRATLAGNPAVAATLRDWHLCRTVFDRCRYVPPVLGWTAASVSDETSREDAGTAPAAGVLEALRERAEALWPAGETLDERYAAFAAPSRTKRETLVAWAVAAQLTGGKRAGAEDDVPEAARAALDVNVAALWRPTAANCFSRLTRERLVALGVEWYGEGFRTETAKVSKKALVERFERLFHGPDDALTDAERTIRATWLPDGVR